MVQRWLALRLDGITLVVIVATAILGILERGSITASQVGLALSYALQMTAMFQWTIRGASDCTTQMTVRYAAPIRIFF